MYPSLEPFKKQIGMRYALLLIATIGFGIARFVVPVEGRIDTSDIFKDMSHVFVGGLFGAAILSRRDWRLWALAIGLTGLEVVAFLIRRAS